MRAFMDVLRLHHFMWGHAGRKLARFLNAQPREAMPIGISKRPTTIQRKYNFAPLKYNLSGGRFFGGPIYGKVRRAVSGAEFAA